jgi:tetratricopeptide (TPR) repeat protein
MNEDKNKKSASLYNLGNSLLMANKVQESIDAYKSSLKIDPENMETKYNLAYAQDLLKKQQQQQQKDQQKQNQDKNDQKKDQQNKQDNKDQNQDKKQDQNQNNDQKQQPRQQQQQQGISKEDAERVLNALANDEKNVQEKVKLAKATKAKVRTVKNW